MDSANTGWMGRYRPLVAALVQHSNIIMEGAGARTEKYEGLYLTSKEWQTLEYIVEHREDDEKMIHMSEALGIKQCSFSKITKTLCSFGLVERYHSSDNRKDVFLKPTDFAMKVFEYHTSKTYSSHYKAFFDALDSVSDEDIKTVANAITVLNDYIARGREQPGSAYAVKKERVLLKMD